MSVLMKSQRPEVAPPTSSQPPLPIQIRVMHGFEFSRGGSPQALPASIERILAYLVIQDRPQHRSTVATALWMDTASERAAANLRQALWKGKHMIGDCLIVEGSYISVSDRVDVDVRRLVGQVRRLFDDNAELAETDCDPVDLCGDLLPNWDEEWIEFERERLRQLRIHGLEALCRKLSGRGRAGEAVDAGLAAVAAEPLRESAQVALISAHLREGNLCEARLQYRRYRDLLWDELGVEPSELLRGLVSPRAG